MLRIVHPAPLGVLLEEFGEKLQILLVHNPIVVQYGPGSHAVQKRCFFSFVKHVLRDMGLGVRMSIFGYKGGLEPGNRELPMVFDCAYHHVALVVYNFSRERVHCEKLDHKIGDHHLPEVLLVQKSVKVLGF